MESARAMSPAQLPYERSCSNDATRVMVMILYSTIIDCYSRNQNVGHAVEQERLVSQPRKAIITNLTSVLLQIDVDFGRKA